MKELNIEKFSNSNEIGIKFGVISAGQCGGNIADVFASIKNQAGGHLYNCIAINSFSNDLAPLNYIDASKKVLLLGDSKGFGKNPKECEDLINSEENSKLLVDQILDDSFSSADAYIVCAGLGGGTGTGLVSKLIEAIDYFINNTVVEHGYRRRPIIAVISIPRPSDALQPIENAVTYLKKEFSRLLSDNILNSLIIIDNEKAYNEYNLIYKDQPENPYESWLDYSNKIVVQALHEINTIIMYPTEQNVDPSDLKNILGGESGTLNIGKTVLDTSKYDKQQIKDKLFKSFLDSKVIAHTQDISGADSLAYFIVKPASTNKEVVNEVIDDLQRYINEEVPFARISESAVIENLDPDDTNLYIYNLSKVSSLPQAITALSEEYINKKRSRTEKRTSNFNFGNSSELDKAIAEKEQQRISKPPFGVSNNPFQPKKNLTQDKPSFRDVRDMMETSNFYKK